jgi:hypothetical protein
MWSLQPVTLAAKAMAPLTVADMMGETQRIEPAGAEASLALSDAPIFVIGAIDSLPPVAPGENEGTVLADSVQDFSDTQGKDNWSYGYFVAPKPGGPYTAAGFKPLTQYRVTDWKEEWTGEPKWVSITAGGLHPGTEKGRAVWAVRRWINKTEGTARITGEARRGPKGDGSTVRILVDGADVFTRLLGGGQPVAVKFDLTVPLHVDSTVDFAVDPGPAASVDFDGVSLAGTVRRPPVRNP